MVDLVLLLESAEDRDGVLHRGLADHHGLEAALQRRVLLDVLAVLVEGRGADTAELAAGQRRLEHVGRIHGAFRGPRADQRVELVDEADDLALRLGDLAEDGLEAILELAAVLRAGHHGPDVEPHQALPLEPLRHVPRHDALGESLHDGRLAHAGLADEHGVVLGPPGEHLDDPPDLLVAPDHGVELAPARQLREVLGIALERLVLLLGIHVGHALGAAHVHQRPVDCLRCHALAREDAGGRARLLLGDADEQVLGGAVLVLEALGLVPGAVQDGFEPRGDVLPPAATHLGELVKLGLHLAPDGLGVGSELGQERAHHTLLLLHEGQQQMLGLEPLMVSLIREGLGGLDRFARFHRQLVESHLGISGRSSLSSINNSFSRGPSPVGTVTCTRTYWSPPPPPLRWGMP